MHPYRMPGAVEKELPLTVPGPSKWSIIKLRLYRIEWGFVFLFLLATAYGISASAVYSMVAYSYATMGRLLWIPYAFTSTLALITGMFSAYFVFNVIKES